MEKNKGAEIFVLGAVGLGIAALVIAAKGTGKVSIALIPATGPSGTVVDVTGAGWSPSETITSVTVGGVTAIHTLTVNTTGKLSGRITIPQLNDGAQTVVIAGSKTGIKTFSKAFTVTTVTVQWTLMTSTPTTLAVGKEVGTPEWILMGSTTLAVGKEVGTPTWILMGSTTLAVDKEVGTPTWALMGSTTLAVGKASVVPPAEVSNFVIYSHDFTVSRGGTCNVIVGFRYRGPVTSPTLYAAIGNVILGIFDEYLHNGTTVSVPETIDWTFYTRMVSISIPQNAKTGTYDLYAKMYGSGFPDVISDVHNDCVTIT
jgi:hypothetical protein